MTCKNILKNAKKLKPLLSVKNELSTLEKVTGQEIYICNILVIGDTTSAPALDIVGQ